MNIKKQKWDKAYEDADFRTATAASVLADNSHSLPLTNGKPLNALDLACGRAGNAQFLAKLGFTVDALDISSVLIDGLTAFVIKEKLDIQCIERDIESKSNDSGAINNKQLDKKYDVIVVSYFLNRELFPQIKDALKPNGLLFYQTWSQLKADESGPSNPNFRLASGELLELCGGLKPIFYCENGLEGDLTKGLRNEALIIAKKIK